MSESKYSKLLWIAIGAVIGTVISFSFEYWIKPYFAPKPLIKITATSEPGTNVADFIISNLGNAPAEDITVTLWATAAFAPRTDIVTVGNAGGVSDADCEYGIYESRLTSVGSRPIAWNTEARAAQIKCDRINPKEKFKGHLEFSGPEAVFGLTTHIKAVGISDNQYARFDE